MKDFLSIAVVLQLKGLYKAHKESTNITDSIRQEGDTCTDQFEVLQNEATVETEVNYVGEYVYDTKLDKDEIHKEFWKKLKENFKCGVDEFSDGSKCNEKIIIFWGKCKFKEGFDRS